MPLERLRVQSGNSSRAVYGLDEQGVPQVSGEGQGHRPACGKLPQLIPGSSQEALGLSLICKFTCLQGESQGMQSACKSWWLFSCPVAGKGEGWRLHHLSHFSERRNAVKVKH